MSLRYGKNELSTMAEVVDGEYDDVAGAASAALAAAEAIFEKRCKFAVVGQLASNQERGAIPASDPEAIKLCLGWYSTEGDARSAADSLWHSTASGDTFKTWVLPVEHSTAAEFHSRRKQFYVDQAEKARQASAERLRKEIEKQNEAAAERARGGRGSCENCGHVVGEHGFDGASRSACKLPECKDACDKWKEMTRAA